MLITLRAERVKLANQNMGAVEGGDDKHQVGFPIWRQYSTSHRHCILIGQMQRKPSDKNVADHLFGSQKGGRSEMVV